jgi:hypothetical protein
MRHKKYQGAGREGVAHLVQAKYWLQLTKCHEYSQHSLEFFSGKSVCMFFFF